MNIWIKQHFLSSAIEIKQMLFLLLLILMLLLLPLLISLSSLYLISQENILWEHLPLCVCVFHQSVFVFGICVFCVNGTTESERQRKKKWLASNLKWQIEREQTSKKTFKSNSFGVNFLWFPFEIYLFFLLFYSLFSYSNFSIRKYRHLAKAIFNSRGAHKTQSVPLQWTR